MAAVTSAVVVAAGSAYAANRQGAAAKEAGRAARDAANQGIGAQQAAQDRFNTNIQPYMDAGTGALSRLSSLNSGDYSGFESSPDYIYARQQTQQGVERGAAARGGLYSGGTDVDLANALNGVASQNLGNYRSSLMDLAGMGQNSVMGAGQLGQQNANALSQLYGDRGAANGQINSAGALTQAGYGNALASGFSSYLGAGGGFGKSQGAAPASGGWGAFAPNRSSSYGAQQPWMGDSAFGAWGKNWGGTY